ncbi:terpene synthase family protein [Streptomyces sp. NPDC001530]|uniref:terpene synthase family protein n=1 Tax=Streptomyces sp. NPDC001530 TaxID=3364582 RepID=UPI00369E82A7
MEKIPRWSCWCYPTAAADRIGGISRLYTLLFALDDTAVHEWGTYGDFMRTLDGTGHDAGPYSTAYKDVWSDLTGAMSSGLRDRHARTQQRWAEALAMENAIRATGYPAHPDVCFPLRRISTGGETIMVPIEHGLGIDLTGVMAQDTDLAGMWRIAGTHVVLVNDLFSMRKEMISGDGMNLLLSLMHHHDLTAQAAVDVLLQRLRNADDEYTRVCRLLRTRYRDHPQGGAMHRYLEGVGHMMAGNVAWHYESRRYHGPGHTWNGHPPTGLVLHPDRTEFEYEQE